MELVVMVLVAGAAVLAVMVDPWDTVVAVGAVVVVDIADMVVVSAVVEGTVRGIFATF